MKKTILLACGLAFEVLVIVPYFILKINLMKK